MGLLKDVENIPTGVPRDSCPARSNTVSLSDCRYWTAAEDDLQENFHHFELLQCSIANGLSGGRGFLTPDLKEGIDYKHQLITNHGRDEVFSHDVLEAVASGSTLTPA